MHTGQFVRYVERDVFYIVLALDLGRLHLTCNNDEETKVLTFSFMGNFAIKRQSYKFPCQKISIHLQTLAAIIFSVKQLQLRQKSLVSHFEFTHMDVTILDHCMYHQ